MRTQLRLAILGLVGLAALAGAPAHAQTFTSGSTGADGPFSPSANVTVTLPPNGVFNYTTVTIPAGVIVRFTKNTANTPVTILASGDDLIEGILKDITQTQELLDSPVQYNALGNGALNCVTFIAHVLGQAGVAFPTVVLPHFVIPELRSPGITTPRFPAGRAPNAP
jgi:hypothetical protein